MTQIPGMDMDGKDTEYGKIQAGYSEKNTGTGTGGIHLLKVHARAREGGGGLLLLVIYFCIYNYN